MLLPSIRFQRTQVARVVHVAIFQQQETGRTVLRNLRRDGFGRSALLRASASGKLRESGVPAASEAAISAVIGLVVGAFLLWREWLQTGPLSALGIALILAGFVLGGVLAGWFVFRMLEKRPHALGRAKFRRSILPNETMVMVESAPDDTSRF
jgi:hypothetical protein